MADTEPVLVGHIDTVATDTVSTDTDPTETVPTETVPTDTVPIDIDIITQYGNDFKQYLERKNIIYENLSEEQIQINFEEFNRAYEPPRKLKNEGKNFIKKIIRKGSIKKTYHIYISGLTGIGKSSFLNSLFGIELPTARFGTGTTARINREVLIGFMKIIVIDPEGLGNVQEGNETTMTHNNADIRQQLGGQDKVINTLIQAFDFESNRFKEEEKIQLKNILVNIDFTKPEPVYLKVVSKLLIVFLKANKYISIYEIKDIVQEILEIINISYEEERELTQLEVSKIRELVNNINNLFQTQFENQVSKVKTMIRKILSEIAPQIKDDPIKIENIISKINFTYAGTIRRNKTVETIPDKFSLRLNDTKLKKYNLKLWDDNWRHDNFNKIFGNTDNTYAYSLHEALVEREGINLTSELDAHNIQNPDMNEYFRLDHNASRNIKEGEKSLFMTSVKAIGTGGGTGLATYGVGTIIGASLLTGAAIPVGIVTGLYSFIKNWFF